MSLNQYTELLYYIKSLAEDDIFVNTVTQGEIQDIDLDKGNIFPLIHVAITNANFNNGRTITFSVEIASLAVRDKVNEVNNLTGIDKFWKQDNEVDNMNETLATLNRMWLIMYRDFDDNNITSSENPTLTPLYMTNKNLLDGWLMTFDIEVPNTTINLCQ